MGTVYKLLAAAIVVLSLAFTGTAGALEVSWMGGATSPGTPAAYDKVGVIKIGPAHAKNVLVLEPGTSAGGAYFVPLARWITSRAKGWQVWTVERRENLLEDQSALDLAKAGQINATQLFDYYLGWLGDKAITHHFNFIPDSTVGFAKRWGMRVAIGDLRSVISAARRLGGRVVLGGHSLGGSIVTAYATWDFAGHAGADQLAGLVYIDGGSFGQESGAAARRALGRLNAPGQSPWQSFGGIKAPLAGLYDAIGSTAALIDPNGSSLGQASGLLNAFKLTPSVPVTNLGEYGYALNVGTSPAGLIAAQAHLGTGIDPAGAVRGWDGRRALTPIRRYAQMFSGLGVTHADGTEWYFPARLTLDSGAVGNGTGTDAGRGLGLNATMGRRLPRTLLIYGFGARLGGRLILNEASALASQSGIPPRNLTLIDRQSTYAHNDPNGAYPHNVFFAHLIPFLRRASAPPR